MIHLRMITRVGTLLIAGLACSSVYAQGISYPDQQEIEDLAANVDKSIQACGIHAAAFGRTEGQALIQRGIALAEEAPEAISALTSSSSLGPSRYHRWLDSHSEIWLIASKEKPSCRIAISHSKWVDKIGSKLAELVQIGNFWRPANESESPVLQTVGGNIQVSYVMDVPAPALVQPLLIITTPQTGTMLAGGQQMIITVMMMAKN